MPGIHPPKTARTNRLPGLSALPALLLLACTPDPKDRAPGDGTDPDTYVGDTDPDTSTGDYVVDLTGDFEDFCDGYAARSVEGNVDLSAATQAEVDSLACLSSVGGDFTISENYTLMNLDGLASLTSVGGDLDIGYNDALTDVDGLASLTSIGGYLSIYRNAALCESSVDALLLRLAGFGYAGATTISGNDSGC